MPYTVSQSKTRAPCPPKTNTTTRGSGLCLYPYLHATRVPQLDEGTRVCNVLMLMVMRGCRRPSDQPRVPPAHRLGSGLLLLLAARVPTQPPPEALIRVWVRMRVRVGARVEVGVRVGVGDGVGVRDMGSVSLVSVQSSQARVWASLTPALTLNQTLPQTLTLTTWVCVTNRERRG